MTQDEAVLAVVDAASAEGLKFDRVVRSEDCVGLMFFGDRRYSLIEIEGDGSMYAMHSDRAADDCGAWELEAAGVAAAVRAAKAFADGGAP